MKRNLFVRWLCAARDLKRMKSGKTERLLDHMQPDEVKLAAQGAGPTVVAVLTVLASGLALLVFSVWQVGKLQPHEGVLRTIALVLSVGLFLLALFLPNLLRWAGQVDSQMKIGEWEMQFNQQKTVSV